MGEKKTDTISEEKASAERTSAGDQVCPEANDAQDLCERILDGWLKMSTAISNERIVSAMTYNESMVCGALYQVQSGGASLLTATRLCSRLQILKPQMNVILNGLEKRGLIRRERSSKDHRQVHILLTKEGENVYASAHQELLALPQGLIDRLGAEKMSLFADLMHTVAENFQEMRDQSENEDSKKALKCPRQKEE
ncbi:MAG: MarR family transcriptional regulator [Lachnospiraceae bacterium]|nr:MarR family transcriptional regulator [Lachnospiraceae bacterium]